MADTNPDEGPLLELRRALDTLDHDLLDLLVRRMEIVAEIAARKREHRVRIRDLERERRDQVGSSSVARCDHAEHPISRRCSSCVFALRP